MACLTPRLRTRLIAHFVAACPAEGCGLLGGHRREGRLTATTFEPLANILGAADRFAVDPGDFLRGVAALEAQGLTWLGFTHSHPGGTTAPSSTDVAQLWRDCLQVIAAPMPDGNWALAAWWLPGRPGPADGCRQLIVEDRPA